ncbi:NAD(P)-binding domain-containing protein [bacterium]|nr:NAD(P)-binding domain-containing protein [bacterium]
MRWAAFIAGAIVIAFVGAMLATHRSYEPGPLLAAHQSLSGGCASCHAPWRGVQNQRCIACHGSIEDMNPHGGLDVTSSIDGLIAGKRLFVTPDNELTCRSCHREHQGARVDLEATATFACQWCHKHPSIAGVQEHMAAFMERHEAASYTFRKPFNHHEHKLLMESHYPAIPGGFRCESCHSIEPVKPPGAEKMSFKWSGCAGAGCHLAPQDSFLQLPASVGTSPKTLPYTSRVLHINAVFTHSPGHLRTPCVECHFAMASSVAPDDEASLKIEQCFKCHAHQGAAPEVAALRWIGQGAVAFAADDRAAGGAVAKHVTACSDCHLFHTHGPVPSNDFTRRALTRLPGAEKRVVLTIPLPVLSAHGHARAPFAAQAITIRLWPIGLAGLAVAAICIFGLVMMLPKAPVEPDVIAGVAPQRTRETPALDDTFQTSVRRLYVIGEAAGTASINLAMRSGRQVIEAIAAELRRMPRSTDPNLYDVLIVGCGPAGLGATATAASMGLNYVTLERMTPASTLRAYPRAKFVQATPIDIAEYGSFFLEGDNSRERLIQEWERIIAELKLVIKDREEVVDIAASGERFFVRTERGNVYRARTVVLAIGVRGNPRRLGLAGEEPGRVFYNLIDANEFHQRRILVVGGGNSGSEVVQALARPELGNHVVYSYRSAVLTNVSRDNAERVSDLQRAGLVTVLPATALKRILPGKVVLERVKSAPATGSAEVEAAGPIELDNDVIFAMIGAELPTGFLRKIGVRLIRKGGIGLI